MINRLLPIISIYTLVFGLAHYFVFHVAGASLFAPDSLIFAILLIVGLFSMPVGFTASYSPNKNLRFLTWAGYVWMGFFSNLFFLSILEGISFLIYPHPHSEWVILASAGIGIWALIKGLKLPTVNIHELTETPIKNFKLVQISDLHIGMLHLNSKWLEKVINKIIPLNPDAVVITGDLVEGNYEDVSPQLEVLKKLSHVKNKFYITGNHEYIHSSELWESRLNELGFIPLHNENKKIIHEDKTILMAGVPDRSVSRFRRDKKSLPDVALSSDSISHYKILLAHQPASVFDLKNETCDLILSGHTHGGQIFPFHLIVRMVQPVNAGLKEINGINVFAHRGTGLWGPPMRWFSQSEIVLHHFK